MCFLLRRTLQWSHWRRMSQEMAVELMAASFSRQQVKRMKEGSFCSASIQVGI